MTDYGKTRIENRCHAPYNLGMYHATLKYLALLALLLLPALSSQALEGDTEQPIRILADEAVRDEKTGQTIYRGNVHMDQGTIRIEADQITIYKVKVEGDRIVAEGSPAHMAQQPKPDSPLMHAWGGVIEYYRTEERILLRDDAQLEQDGSTVRGDRIDYLINEEIVKAATDETSNTRRVEVVIPPHKLEE
jgi:lipopolysaccharide export system protein LptA